MKAETIKNQINYYDQNKGHFRILKDEPHIKELREFCNNKLQGVNTLSPPLLLELAAILLGKNDRDGEALSSHIFRDLVQGLGGYETLESLKKYKQLSAENIVFIEKNHKQANLLTPLLISIGSKLSPSTMTIMFHAAEMMSDQERLIEMFNCFEKFALSENAGLYFELINFLNRYGINTDDVVLLLSEAKQLVSIKKTLDVLERTNSQLLNRDNIIAILKLQNPYYFYKVLELLPDTQESLNRLFAVDNILDKCSRAEEIIKNFKKAGWELEPYLKYILSADRNGVDLESATSMLMEIKFKPELLPFVLETLFARSNESIALVKAVGLLNDEHLKEDMDLAFASKYPDRVAAAIVELRKEQCFNKQTRRIIRSHPEHAVELAQALIQLNRLNHAGRAAYDGIVKYPQNADKVAQVLEYLQKNFLLHNLNGKPDAYKGIVKQSSHSIITEVCKAELTDDSLIKLFEAMKAANLLDIPNLNKLMPKLKYVKTLATAATCLANSNKLNQTNFNSIIGAPFDAMVIAESLGGTPRSPSLPERIDEGAKDFVEIRKAAKILAQGQQQGLFFAKQDPEKIGTFEKVTHKKMAAVQNEAMMKIAEHTSEHHLEDVTEHHTANSSYFSVLKT
ncbi:Uncharacterised protein [Legionella steigerwaltii]|uniref:Uncharacterized protein n=1 Tax=Legionella steigerwaltii TaxID=460 RepID=A0A378LFG8_9GAMM|nr:hypothetical protein [Legionella steigerwaltii]KTD77521.1 hypothetical protein Lstg_1878 [Legionella steigerwaltii]STY22831.1 Uncharacterised protein [Legionella steigerwaltii]